MVVVAVVAALVSQSCHITVVAWHGGGHGICVAVVTWHSSGHGICIVVVTVVVSCHVAVVGVVLHRSGSGSC